MLIDTVIKPNAELQPTALYGIHCNIYFINVPRNNHNLKASVQVLQRFTISTIEYLHAGEVTGNAWMRYWHAISALNAFSASSKRQSCTKIRSQKNTHSEVLYTVNTWHSGGPRRAGVVAYLEVFTCLRFRDSDTRKPGTMRR